MGMVIKVLNPVSRTLKSLQIIGKEEGNIMNQITVVGNVHLVCFNRPMSFRGVVRELDKLGLQFIELYELKEFDLMHPSEKWKHPIITADYTKRTVDGGTHLECLGRDGDADHIAALLYYEGFFSGDCCFATKK